MLIFLSGLSAVLCIASESSGRRIGFYAFKPLTMFCLLVYAISESGDQPLLWLALLFSLAGDVWLMFPQRFFLHGLISFFIAHVFYIGLFWPSQWTFGLLMILLLLLTLTVVYWRYLLPHTKKLQKAVIAYSLALMFMVGFGWHQAIEKGALSLGLGVLLFMVSDMSLAWNKFVQPFRLAQVLILSTYFAAQILIVLAY